MPDSLGLMNLGVLTAPAVVLLALERYRNRPSASTPLLQLVGWTLLFFGILGPLTAIFHIFSLVALPVFLTTMLMMADRQRNAEHRALLKLFSASAERGIPLSDSARAFAEENATDTGLRARVFAQALDSGMSVGEAARSAWLRMSTGVRLALALNDNGGMLGTSLKSQLEDRTGTEHLQRKVAGKLLYLCLLTSFLWISFFLINGFVTLKIVPVYQRLFGLQLPALTESFQRFSLAWVGPGATMLHLIAWGGIGILAVFCTLAYIGWLWCDFPFLRRWFWRYDGAIILRALAGLARQGRSFPEGIALFAKLYPRWSVRKRLLRAQRRLSAGEEWTAALVGAGIIPSAEAAVLRAAERVGNVPWALEEMADQLLRRMLYRVQLLLQFLFPACALAGGVVTLLFALAYFIPLVGLIQALA